jgi:hypothetical protein
LLHDDVQVLRLAGGLTRIKEVLRHGVCFLFGLERSQLKPNRTAVLVGQEVVEFRGVGVHAADEVLDSIELDSCDALTCNMVLI